MALDRGVDTAQKVELECILLEKVSHSTLVARRVKQDATGWQTVPPRTSRLLIVVLQGLGRAVVNDKAHIGLVHPHAKRDGRHDDTGLIAHEAILNGSAVLDPGVIMDGRQSLAAQHCGQLLAFGAGVGVDDAAALDLAAQGEQRTLLLCITGKVVGFKLQVGAMDIDGHQTHLAQGALDVIADPWGSSGSHGQDRGPAQVVPGLGDEVIVWAKVMAPKADAVSFIHHQERDAGSFQRVQKGPLAQPLWCAIEQLVAATGSTREPGLHFSALQGAVYGGR